MLELVPLAVGVFLAQISPGPNLMAVSAQALGAGRRAGVLTAAGVATGAFVWAVLFIVGLGAVVLAVPETLVAMKLMGGAYLLYMGMRALMAARRADAVAKIAKPGSGRRAYLTGMAVVLTNPKAMLMWAAVSAYLAGSGLGLAASFALGSAFALSAFVIYGWYAWLFSTGRARAVYGRFFRGIEAAFGAVFGLIGVRLIFDGVRGLRG